MIAFRRSFSSIDHADAAAWCPVTAATIILIIVVLPMLALAGVEDEHGAFRQQGSLHDRQRRRDGDALAGVVGGHVHEPVVGQELHRLRDGLGRAVLWFRHQSPRSRRAP